MSEQEHMEDPNHLPQPEQPDPYDFEASIQDLLSTYDYDQRNQMYFALCNNIWCKDGRSYLSTWRNAGDIVADMSRGETYMTYYCNGYESVVSEMIMNDLHALGWYLNYKSDGYPEYKIMYEAQKMKDNP